MSDNAVPTNWDEFLNPNVEIPSDPAEDTMTTRFEKERIVWQGKVKEMGQKLKTVSQVGELMTEIYTERQMALEYYHYLISLLISINKSFNKQYSEKYKFYSYTSQERFPNETAKNNRIYAELADLKEKREILDNHAKFMDGTVKTIDNITFGIKTRVEIEQIGRGK